MIKKPEEISCKINNDCYDSPDIGWWDKKSPFNLIESLLNPVRFGWFKKILSDLKVNPENKQALDIGCGGGILSEDISRLGFISSGIDPSKNSIETAKEHSLRSDLKINYQIASGEDLPFQDNSFDVVFCCDVLEHVKDLPLVISEISRVLKEGGIFFYDTINRTLMSKIIVIKILQDWKHWSLFPEKLHIWEMLITPKEMKEILQLKNLEWKEHLGIRPDHLNFKILNYLHKCKSGKMSYEEFGRKIKFTEGGFKQISYMGYAIKKTS